MLLRKSGIETSVACSGIRQKTGVSGGWRRRRMTEGKVGEVVQG